MKATTSQPPSARLLFCLLTTLIVFAIAASVPANAQVNAAIQTTLSDGSIVNFNVKPPKSCDAIYITGGAQNTSAAGLSPDGTYYFQVTDPSGKTVLSTDDVSARTINVGKVTGTDGRITGYTGSNGEHLVGDTFNLANKETTVRLWPFTQTPNNGGVYKAWISTDPTFVNSTTKTDNFKCTVPITLCAPDDVACICAADPTNAICSEPPASATITGYKFYDANTDGTFDPTEVGIRDWLIQITPPAEADVNTDPSGVSCGFTSASPVGQYQFTVDPLSSHDINEGNALTPTSWLHTNNPGPITVIAGTGGTDTAGPNFGNVCTGAGGGLTLGFWSNKNGQKLETVADFTFLSSLNLVNAVGAAFNPTTTSGFSSWLLNANAVNMAYMLSAQLAAMELNVRHNFVSGTALVLIGAPPNANCFSISGEVAPNSAGFIGVNDLMNDANLELGASGGNYTVATSDQRSCEGYKKSALDNANNNLTFVQADQSSCPAFSFDSTILNACTF
jgi:hypothetical protein